MRKLILLLLLAVPAAAQITNGGGGSGAFAGGSGTSYQDVVESAAPANPAAGTERVYADSTSHLLTCIKSDGSNCLVTTPTLNSLADPTGNKAFTMVANTLNFNFTGNYGANWAYSVSSAAANGGTGYLFLVSAGDAGNKPFQFCASGSKCFQMSGAGVMTVSGGATMPPVTYSKTIVVGAENGAVLLDADLGPQRAQFQIPVASTITEIDVKADAAAGVSPTNVIVAKRVCTASPCGTGANETVTNLLSGALAVTATSGATTCSRTAAVAGIDGFTTCTNTLQNNTSFPAGGYIELVSGTADGTTKRLSVTVTWTTP